MRGPAERTLDRRWSSAVWPLAAVVAAFAAHASVLSGGFNWLDHGDIEQGRVVLPLDELSRAFTEPFGGTGFYRPLVTVTLSLDHALYGTSPAGYHLTNLLLGCALVAAVYLLLRVFFELERGAAGLGALVVAVHPLTWLPFGAIAYRPELLVTLFGALALGLYVRARSRGRIPWAAALAFYAALPSKETAIVWLPLLFGIWELVRGAGAERLRDRLGLGRRAIAALAMMAAVAILYLLQRFAVVSPGWWLSGREMSLSEAIGTRLAVVGRRLAELVAIEPPALSDATTIVGLGHPAAITALAAIVAAAVVVVRRGIGDRWVRPLLFLAVALSPALNLLPLPRFSSPHYSFFALPAFAALVGLIWERASAARLTAVVKILGALLVGVWIATMAAATHRASGRFVDDRALFAPEVAADPGFREGWHYLGDYYLDAGNLDAAAAAFERALAEDPERIAYVDEASVRIDLAICRLRQGRLREADGLLVQAAGEAPPEMQPIIRFNRALVALRAGRPDLVRRRLGPLAEGLEGDAEELLERARDRVRSASP